MLKKIFKWLANTFLILIFLLILISSYSRITQKNNTINNPKGLFTVSILSGSMEPYFEAGDMAIERRVDVNDIKVGSIITYKKLDQDIMITHRVVGVYSNNGILSFKTKGDACEKEDDVLVYKEQIVGKTLLKVPNGGYIINFLKTPIGFTLVIVIPVLILIIMELKNVYIVISKKSEINEINI